MDLCIQTQTINQIHSRAYFSLYFDVLASGKQTLNL